MPEIPVIHLLDTVRSDAACGAHANAQAPCASRVMQHLVTCPACIEHLETMSHARPDEPHCPHCLSTNIAPPPANLLLDADALSRWSHYCLTCGVLLNPDNLH